MIFALPNITNIMINSYFWRWHIQFNVYHSMLNAYLPIHTQLQRQKLAFIKIEWTSELLLLLINMLLAMNSHFVNFHFGHGLIGAMAEMDQRVHWTTDCNSINPWLYMKRRFLKIIIMIPFTDQSKNIAKYACRHRFATQRQRAERAQYQNEIGA